MGTYVVVTLRDTGARRGVRDVAIPISGAIDHNRSDGVATAIDCSPSPTSVTVVVASIRGHVNGHTLVGPEHGLIAASRSALRVTEEAGLFDADADFVGLTDRRSHDGGWNGQEEK